MLLKLSVLYEGLTVKTNCATCADLLLVEYLATCANGAKCIISTVSPRFASGLQRRYRATQTFVSQLLVFSVGGIWGQLDHFALQHASE